MQSLTSRALSQPNKSKRTQKKNALKGTRTIFEILLDACFSLTKVLKVTAKSSHKNVITTSRALQVCYEGHFVIPFGALSNKDMHILNNNELEN